jgi:hypothetical protein
MKTRKLIAVMLLTFILISMFSCAAAFAEEVTTPENEPDTEPMVYVDTDIFGWTGWPSIGMAKSYYGFDFTYVFCGGGLYNWFYYFSDGTRMFFGVHES